MQALGDWYVEKSRKDDKADFQDILEVLDRNASWEPSREGSVVLVKTGRVGIHRVNENRTIGVYSLLI